MHALKIIYVEKRGHGLDRNDLPAAYPLWDASAPIMPEV